MSFAKYAQFYRDNGFFAGSKIKATITDNSFIGQTIILSKGRSILQTRIIPVTGVAEFFTDASGELTLSVNDGTSTLTKNVTVTTYGTYNVTVDGALSDTSRVAYANDVTMDSESATAKVAYTGDISTITAVASDTSLVNLSVNGNKILITGKGKTGSCNITATVAQTSNYQSASVTFRVNKTA